MKTILLILALALCGTANAQVNRVGTVLASAARTATVIGQDIPNDNYRGIHLIVDVTAVPGGDTITPKIQGKDQTSGKYYDVLVGAAISATGTTVLKIYPSIAPTANAAAQDLLPQIWRIVVTHSAGTSFTYSVGYNADY